MEVKRSTITAGLIAALYCTPALAATRAEEGDAGATVATAQALDGTGALDAISGAISSGTDQDVYRVCLTGGGTFSATTTIATAAGDTQLFLFDDQGRGIATNDDASSATFRSTLPAGHPLTPQAPGRYLLAVSAFDDDPLDAAGNRIFGAAVGVGVFGPVDPAAVLTSWSVNASGTGAYTVTLAGAELCLNDTVPPTIEITSPGDGADYLLGSELPASFACADETALATCSGEAANGALLDTSAVGPRSFTVSATDAAGNAASLTHSYRVVWPFDGPLRPLGPGLNERTAGAAVPYKFSLGGDRGSDPVASVTTIACGGGDVTPASVGPTSYEDGVYQFDWKTENAWGDSCRELLVELADGSVHHTVFRFT